MRITRLTPEQAENVGRAMARAMAFVRQIVDAFREMARQAVCTLAALADFARRQTAHPAVASAGQRPAWMSPYGPPQRGRHRRP
ncbi:hypothetical protein [Streptomyces mirabilis]|uniref:hypothetical protein n=1 Tax=Streptomyces mirabilis TaxID=68239 RepID=UPI002250D43E|nr:hypothetical protein [Streptomyces mirabilis]MCX4609477.1 hypothetical protein [Streptomyces mirabilis]